MYTTQKKPLLKPSKQINCLNIISKKQRMLYCSRHNRQSDTMDRNVVLSIKLQESSSSSPILSRGNCSLQFPNKWSSAPHMKDEGYHFSEQTLKPSQLPAMKIWDQPDATQPVWQCYYTPPELLITLLLVTCHIVATHANKLLIAPWPRHCIF